MTHPSTNYLRLIRDDDASAVDSERCDDSVATEVRRTDAPASHRPTIVDHVEGFWRAYTEATGWRIDTGRPRQRAGTIAINADESEDEFDVLPAVSSDMMLASGLAVPTVSASDAKKLARAATRMAAQLQQQQAILREHQAELAARASLITSGRDRQSCHQQIERILSDAAIATGTIAGAIYLLDEETEFLTTRFLFGLAPEGRLGVRRPLRGSRADLEAMVQGVLAIDDVLLGPIDTWRCPEPFSAALCSSLGGTDLPIGTLWLFAPESRSFGAMHTASARMAAENVHQTLLAQDRSTSQSRKLPSSAMKTRIAPEIASAVSSESLERESMVDTDAEAIVGRIDLATLTAAKAKHLDTLLDSVARWQHHTLPIGTRLANDWYVDGMIESPIEISQSWHHWDVLPDGQLAVGICQSAMAGRGRLDMHDVLSMTLARAALQAHTAYRHQPSDAIRRVLDTLWQIDEHAIDDDGRPAISLTYAHVDPETGELNGAMIGRWTSMIASRYGYRPLGDQHGDIDPDLFRQSLSDAELGTHPIDRLPSVFSTVLQQGEVLFIGGGSWLQTPISASTKNHLGNQVAVGNALKRAMADGGRQPLAAVRRLVADAKIAQELTAISLQRAN